MVLIKLTQGSLGAWSLHSPVEALQRRKIFILHYVASLYFPFDEYISRFL